jgi:hypothetical protein
MKKYLDLSQEHLWVVYPRTRDSNPPVKKDGKKEFKKEKESPPNEVILHLQIVGVWEPGLLQKGTPLAENPVANALESQDGYFSIRGEVIFNSQEKKFVMVKIQQQPRKKTEKGKAFKVRLEGVVDMKSPGYFWDLHVQRQANHLVIQAASPVGVLPPRKIPKTARPAKPQSRKPTPERSERYIGTSDPPTSSNTERRYQASRPSRRAPSSPSS